MKKFVKVLMIILLIACVSMAVVACGKDTGVKTDNNSGATDGTGSTNTDNETENTDIDNEKENTKPDATVPVYTKMTVTSTVNAIKAHNAAIPQDVEEDNKFLQGVADVVLPSISVNTTNEIEYFAEKENDIFINVHLSNPSGFVILRFTLNGTIYQNYQFESGSTSELLILKINTGDVCGIKDYTIDAIKYIDDADNLTKDVDMTGGDKVVKVGVTYDKTPNVTISEQEITTEKFSFSAEFSDDYNLVKNNGIKAYFYDGTAVLATKTLVKGKNTLSFDGLQDNKTYQYAVIAVFDALDGEGEQKVVLKKGEIKTLAYYYIDNVKVSTKGVKFNVGSNLENADKEVSFNVVAVQTADGKTPFMTDEIGEIDVADLQNDTDYTVAVYYYYEQDGKTVNRAYKVNVHTGMVADEHNWILKDNDIAESAYEYNADVENVYIDRGVTSIGVLAFHSCPNLKKVTIGPDVKEIGAGAFGECEKLTEVIVLGNSLETIGQEAFAGSFNLSKINIPASVRVIAGAFESNEIDVYYGGTLSQLFEIEVGGGFGYKTNFYIDGELLTELVVPNDVVEIPPMLFFGWTGTKLNVNKVEELNGAFSACDNLQEVTVSASNTVYRTEGNCIIQGNTVVAGFKCSVIPASGVDTIGDSAFYCSGMTSIAIPDNIRHIEEYAFAGCDNLTDVYYAGSEEDWKKITIAGANEGLDNATIHYNCTEEQK